MCFGIHVQVLKISDFVEPNYFTYIAKLPFSARTYPFPFPFLPVLNEETSLTCRGRYAVCITCSQVAAPNAASPHPEHFSFDKASTDHHH